MAAHPLDAALAHAAPLRASLHGGNAPIGVGSKDFVAAADGLYVRTASPALSAAALVAPAVDAPLPYAPLQASVVPANGPVPLALLHTFAAWASADADREIAAVIEICGDGYQLRRIDTEDRSAGHVTYDDRLVDDDRLVVDLHSHGRLDAYFSATDDASDRSRRGPYIAFVFGQCHAQPLQCCRLVVSPFLIPLDLSDLVAQGVFA